MVRPRSLSRPSIRRLGAGALALALAALTCAGCGTGHSTSSRSPAAARASSPSSPSSTTSTPTSTGSATTPALPGTGRPTVTIGDKNYTEQFVLGQLYLLALKAQGFTVNITQNIGPPAVFTRALRSGSLAMYPEYLDTFDQTLAHRRDRSRTRSGALRIGRRWATRHGLRLLAPTPFSDTPAIAVTVGYAQHHRLRSLEDLRRVGAQLVLGGAAQYAHLLPGLPALSTTYGVAPATYRSIGVGDQYDDLDDGTVQAAYVASTDGQLASGDYRLLGDPRRVFGVGNVVPVVSAAALAKEGPAFARTIERVDATLTMSAMRELNSEVDVAKQDPAKVAKRYLSTHGLLAPLPGPAGR